MVNIGKRIKELRKKNDLTQEKLADFLGVTYQAVSKWETGIASPDLSLIAPLTRLLNVTADELLGLSAPETDERRAYFDAEYKDFWKKDDHDADYLIAKQAVEEYPGDFRYLEWLATVEYYTSFNDYDDKPKFLDRIDTCIKHNLMVWENCNDDKLRKGALWTIVLAYKYSDRIEEARKYAELYPDVEGTTRDDAIELCLSGDELLEHRQKMISNAFGKLDWALRNISDNGSVNDPRVRAAVEARKKILEAVIPDGNYLGSGNVARGIHWKSAEFALADGDYDKAVDELRKAKMYTVETDRCMTSPKQLYTAILLDHYGHDYSTERPFDRSLTEYWMEEAAQVFAPLKGRADFDELLRSE